MLGPARHGHDLAHPDTAGQLAHRRQAQAGIPRQHLVLVRARAVEAAERDAGIRPAFGSRRFASGPSACASSVKIFTRSPTLIASIFFSSADGSARRGRAQDPRTCEHYWHRRSGYSRCRWEPTCRRCDAGGPAAALFRTHSAPPAHRPVASDLSLNVGRTTYFILNKRVLILKVLFIIHYIISGIKLAVWIDKDISGNVRQYHGMKSQLREIDFNGSCWVIDPLSRIGLYTREFSRQNRVHDQALPYTIFSLASFRHRQFNNGSIPPKGCSGLCNKCL